MLKKIWLSIYYAFITHLPSADKTNSLSGKLREYVCRHILPLMGKEIDIRQNVYFGKGEKLYIGDRSGIGKGSILWMRWDYINWERCYDRSASYDFYSGT